MKKSAYVIICLIAASLTSCDKEPRITISVEASPSQWESILKSNPTVVTP